MSKTDWNLLLLAIIVSFIAVLGWMNVLAATAPRTAWSEDGTLFVEESQAIKAFCLQPPRPQEYHCVLWKSVQTLLEREGVTVRELR